MNNLVSINLPNKFDATYQFPSDKSFGEMLSMIRSERSTLNKLVAQLEELNPSTAFTYADIMHVVEHLTKLFNLNCDLLGIFTDAQASILFNSKHC